MKNVIRSMHGTTMLFLLNKKKTEEIFILTANSRETVWFDFELIYTGIKCHTILNWITSFFLCEWRPVGVIATLQTEQQQ